MAKILDRSRPYGTVVGARDGSIYHQDGVCFGGDDREIGAPPAAVAAQPTPAAADPAPAETSSLVTREELEALHPTKIKALMELNGLVPVAGSGSKAKNIELLLAG